MRPSRLHISFCAQTEGLTSWRSHHHPTRRTIGSCHYWEHDTDNMEEAFAKHERTSSDLNTFYDRSKRPRYDSGGRGGVGARDQVSLASIKSLPSEAYTVGWICALYIERAAAEAMLDEEHATPEDFTKHETDANVYTWGRVGEHNIVIVSLPAGAYGIASAATTASSLLASLPSIRVGLLVGIGGGIARPNEEEGSDIRLGDVAVSQPGGSTGGVCQYDLMKVKSGDRRERKSFLNRPPTVLLNALTSIQARHEREASKIPFFLQEMLEKYPKMAKRSKQNPSYAHQGIENDRLFTPECDHIPGPDCRGCDKTKEVLRDPRDTTDPEIHYGIIASGNTLVKDALARDRIVLDVGQACLCLEMEAAGLMSHFPCLVIRGICDYADSHKSDRWQRYASATAAAYAKELLAYVPAGEVRETKRALEVLQLGKSFVCSLRPARLDDTDVWNMS